MQEYYLGVDLGTNSIGWAVTDSQYNIIRKKGKDLWGIREFDKAIGAVERRNHRVSRRNHQRSQVRIGLVKDFFSDAIDKEDPGFYQRLENSFYKFDEGDKPETINSRFAIFSDSDYTDKDYYSEYPTIFKLKLDLINDAVPFDSRYTRKVFLAILNYFKRRGHFLSESLAADGETVDVIMAFHQLTITLEEKMDMDFSFSEDRGNDIKNLFAKNMSRTARRDELVNIFSVDKKSKQYLILSAICGLKVDLCKLLDIETEQKAEMELSAAGIEDKLPEIYSIIGADYSDVIERIKAVYDAGVLSKIMTGAEWLSEARLRDYEKHKADLALLKKCIRKYCGKDEYDYLFRSDNDGTYSAYIGTVNCEKIGEKVRRGENLSKSKSGDRYDNLKKRIKADLDSFQDDVNVKKIFEELDNETFLPKQLTFANGVIPNQLHARELKRILENASKYLDFLNKSDETGLRVADKIYKLFIFQIPYYVGPVSQNYKGNGWAVRRNGMENAKVYPWNIEEVIDYSATKEEFIKRMVRECTYISGESALPKESMKYQTYMVLNTINCIKIKDEKIPVELKQDIYHDLFEKKNRISKKDILKYLNNRGYDVEENELTGVDSTIGCNLSTYRRFFSVIGEDIKRDSYKAMVDDIVYWGTIYGDTKKLVKEQISEKYGKQISENQLKRILGYRYKDWGNLSAEFLNMIACNKETGEEVSLLRALWEDNLNLMELLNSDKYTFGEALNEKRSSNLKSLSDYSYEDLDNMYFSAPVKRMIWQTILIVKEIVKVMGKYPDKVFVEMTRHDEEKGDAGRKDSREKELLNLYKSIKDDKSWDEEIKEAGVSGKLRSKKLYLYYRQMGCDMYTGEPIDLCELFDDNKYDIDHIYPRHFVKDDSIHNNLVLVQKQKNSRKSDTYPIDASIRSNPKVMDLWERLKEKHFINEEKYRRLTGCNPFSEEQQADFIARQMVETNQAVKGVNDLIKEMLPETTTLVYSKASNVSDFRKEFGIVKSRIINDFHHAHDAYLNIVVGNAYYTKFTSNPMNYIKHEKKDYHLGRMFHKDIVRNGYEAWKAPIWDSNNKLKIVDEGKSLATVYKMLDRNTPMVTRLSLTQCGKLSDATIYSAQKAKADAYIPVKNCDERLKKVESYGGFGSAAIAYYFLVEHEVQGKGKDKGKVNKIRTIECLPLYMRTKVESTPNGLETYCKELGLINPLIRLRKIKPQSLIKVNGFPLYITGKTGNRYVVRNACNLVLRNDMVSYVHTLEKYSQTKNTVALTKENNQEMYEELLNKHLNSIFAKRPTPITETLLAGKDKFYGLSVEEQAYVLLQILNISLICNSANADLRLIEGSSAAGAGRLNKCVDGYESFVLVNQSVTGIYSKEIDLKNV